MPSFFTFRRAAALAAVGSLMLAACGDDGEDDGDRETDEEAEVEGGTAGDGEEQAGHEVLRIQVTNDDGIDAPGIDAVAEALGGLDNVEVHVVAPDDDWSGGSDRRLEGVELEGVEMETASGIAGLGVNGMPADSVVWAQENYFGEEVDEAHLTVSGSNGGQNLGELAYASGTVGAARESARHGVPALAVSTGFGGGLEVTDYEELDYEAILPFMIDWIEENREAILAGELDTDTVTSLNAPTCLEGEIRGLVETTRQESAPEDGPGPLDDVDCESEEDVEGFNDVEAFTHGYATITTVDVEDPNAGDDAAADGPGGEAGDDSDAENGDDGDGN